MSLELPQTIISSEKFSVLVPPVTGVYNIYSTSPLSAAPNPGVNTPYTYNNKPLSGAKYDKYPYWVYDPSPEGFEKAKQYYTTPRQEPGWPDVVIPNNLDEALLKSIPYSTGIPITGAKGQRMLHPYFQGNNNFLFFLTPPVSGTPDPVLFINKKDFCDPKVAYTRITPYKYNCSLFISPRTDTRNEYNIRYNGTTSIRFIRDKNRVSRPQITTIRNIRTKTEINTTRFKNITPSLSGTDELFRNLYIKSLRTSDYGRKKGGEFIINVGPRIFNMLQGLRYYAKRFNNSIHFATSDTMPVIGDVVKVSFKTIQRPHPNNVVIHPKPIASDHSRGDQDVDFEYNFTFYSELKSKKYHQYRYDAGMSSWVQDFVEFTSVSPQSGMWDYSEAQLSSMASVTTWLKSDNKPYSMYGTYAPASSLVTREITPQELNLTQQQQTNVTGKLNLSALQIRNTCTLNTDIPIISISGADIPSDSAPCTVTINAFTTTPQTSELQTAQYDKLFSDGAIQSYRQLTLSGVPIPDLSIFLAPKYAGLRFNFKNLIDINYASTEDVSLLLSSAKISLNILAPINNVIVPVPSPYRIIGAPIIGANIGNKTLYTANEPFNRFNNITINTQLQLSSYRLVINNAVVPTSLVFSSVVSRRKFNKSETLFAIVDRFLDMVNMRQTNSVAIKLTYDKFVSVRRTRTGRLYNTLVQDHNPFRRRRRRNSTHKFTRRRRIRALGY